jgi:hypothetical protein
VPTPASTANTTATANITPRAITVTANAKSKIYGNLDPVLTYQFTSAMLVSGDTFSGSLSRAAVEAVGDYAIQQGTLALSTHLHDLRRRQPDYHATNAATDGSKLSAYFITK